MARGNGTSMISLVIPPKDQVSRISKMLAEEVNQQVFLNHRFMWLMFHHFFFTMFHERSMVRRRISSHELTDYRCLVPLHPPNKS